MRARSERTQGARTIEELVLLPAPRRASATLENALRARRSIRSYARKPLALPQVSELLWAAQGVTGPDASRRTAPSAGALYPLEIRLVAGAVDALSPGLYRYSVQRHGIERSAAADLRSPLRAAAWDQPCIGQGAVVIAISAVYARTTGKYGARGERYVHIEAGHAAQNVSLQAAALGLGTTVVGAFDDAAVAEILGLDPSESPLLLLPVGPCEPGAKRSSRGPR
jgi:SagB-type dehydrogenase family enzyme